MFGRRSAEPFQGLMLGRLAVLCLAAQLFGGCNCTGEEAPPDAAEDVGPDVPPDVPEEVGPDADPSDTPTAEVSPDVPETEVIDEVTPDAEVGPDVDDDAVVVLPIPGATGISAGGAPVSSPRFSGTVSVGGPAPTGGAASSRYGAQFGAGAQPGTSR